MDNSKEQKLSIIMPIFNEAPCLEHVSLDHIKVVSSIVEIDDWEIVCLDDGSTDRSLDILTRLSSSIPKLKIIVNERNQGINASFIKLQDSAQGDLICQTAADGQ